MRPPPQDPIKVNVIARKIDVDNRLPLRNYYRIADNLLKQASIYREENNTIDLYIILLRYSSLVSETIPFHRDYQVLLPKERAFYRKKLLAVLDELESLQPKFRHLLNELNKGWKGAREYQFDTQETTSVSSRLENNLLQPARKAPLSSWKPNNEYTQVLPTNSIDNRFQKLSLNIPIPKQETLSRHSSLGANGLQGQWLGPSPEIKVYYPSTADLTPNENSGPGLHQNLVIPVLNMQTCTSVFATDFSPKIIFFPRGILMYRNNATEYDRVTVKDGGSGVDKFTMETLLSLDEGRWSDPADELCPPLNNEASNGPLLLGNIRQPSPPPVLAQVQPEFAPVSPPGVADLRPGLAKPFPDGMHSSNSYQHLHIPVKMMQDFLRLARENTTKNLETCGVLAGSLKNRVFHITTLIIPKQESTSDSCQTLNEEEIFEVQDNFSLFPLGWIHTHPSQTCFMSSVDLHTHYSYQIMLPEAIAIVMAPTDKSSPHGIFQLSDPGGVSAIRNCQQRGFHPHEEPEDGSPIYEHCSHVYMNPNLKFDRVDLR